MPTAIKTPALDLSPYIAAAVRAMRLVEQAEKILADLDTSLGVVLLTSPPDSQTETLALGLARVRSRLTLACAAMPGEVWEKRLSADVPADFLTTVRSF
jgi:hypothetical protein